MIGTMKKCSISVTSIITNEIRSKTLCHPPSGSTHRKHKQKECDMNQVPLTRYRYGDLDAPSSQGFRVTQAVHCRWTLVTFQTQHYPYPFNLLAYFTSSVIGITSITKYSCNKPHDNTCTCTCTCKNHLNNADIAPLRYNAASINKWLSDTFTPR